MYNYRIIMALILWDSITWASLGQDIIFMVYGVSKISSISHKNMSWICHFHFHDISIGWFVAHVFWGHTFYIAAIATSTGSAPRWTTSSMVGNCQWFCPHLRRKVIRTRGERAVWFSFHMTLGIFVSRCIQLHQLGYLGRILTQNLLLTLSFKPKNGVFMRTWKLG